MNARDGCCAPEELARGSRRLCVAAEDHGDSTVADLVKAAVTTSTRPDRAVAKLRVSNEVEEWRSATEVCGQRRSAAEINGYDIGLVALHKEGTRQSSGQRWIPEDEVVAARPPGQPTVDPVSYGGDRLDTASTVTELRVGFGVWRMCPCRGHRTQSVLGCGNGCVHVRLDMMENVNVIAKN